MSVHRRARCAASAWLHSPLRVLKGLAALAFAAMAAACWSTPPAPLSGPDPSDPKVRTPAVGYRSTIEPYAAGRPAEPAPWRERNEQVAPKAKQ